MDDRFIILFRRGFYRSSLLIFLLFSLSLQGQVLEILMENNQNIFIINQYLIYLSNLIILIYPIILQFNKYLIFNNLLTLFDFALRLVTLLINLMIEQEFYYLSFYFWNFFNIMICITNFFLLITYENKSNLFPGEFINTNVTCPICMLSKSDWCLPCDHHFHRDCLEKWFKFNKSCPNCRKYFNFIN